MADTRPTMADAQIKLADTQIKLADAMVHKPHKIGICQPHLALKPNKLQR